MNPFVWAALWQLQSARMFALMWGAHGSTHEATVTNLDEKRGA